MHGHLGWILSVPDTHQKTVLAALDKEDSIRVVTCATEDEATAIAAGLHVGGEPVVLMIQHAGLYASVNTLRGVAMDGRVPIFYMIGLLSREKDKDPRESRHSMVRYCEPLLDTFGVPHARLEGPNDVHLIPEYYRLSRAAPRAGGRAGRAGDGLTWLPRARDDREARGRPAGARGRARRRHRGPDHDHRSRVAEHRARRPVGDLRGLHGRRLVARTRDGARPP